MGDTVVEERLVVLPGDERGDECRALVAPLCGGLGDALDVERMIRQELGLGVELGIREDLRVRDVNDYIKVGRRSRSMLNLVLLGMAPEMMRLAGESVRGERELSAGQEKMLMFLLGKVLPTIKFDETPVEVQAEESIEQYLDKGGAVKREKKVRRIRSAL